MKFDKIFLPDIRRTLFFKGCGEIKGWMDIGIQLKILRMETP